MSRRVSTLLLSVAIVLLLVFNLSLWAWTSVINSDNFVDRTSTILTDDASLDALASRIVDQLLAERPIVLAVLGDTLKGTVSGLLGSDRFVALFETLAGAIHRVLTSGGVDDVSIDISGLRDILIAVLAVVDRDGDAATRVANAPDELVLFQGRDFPATERISNSIPWVCVVSGLLAAGLIALVFALTRDRHSALHRFSLMLIFLGIISIILLLPARAVTLSSFPLEDQRTIAATLFDSFARRLVVQSLLLIMIGGGLYGWSTSLVRPETSAPPASEPEPSAAAAAGAD